jgi:hypothetical protein
MKCFIFTVFVFIFAQKASAYMTIAESAELVPEKQFRISIEALVISTNFYFNSNYILISKKMMYHLNINKKV